MLFCLSHRSENLPEFGFQVLREQEPPHQPGSLVCAHAVSQRQDSGTGQWCCRGNRGVVWPRGVVGMAGGHGVWNRHVSSTGTDRAGERGREVLEGLCENFAFSPLSFMSIIIRLDEITFLSQCNARKIWAATQFFCLLFSSVHRFHVSILPTTALLRQMDMGSFSVTCAQIWVRAIHTKRGQAQARLHTSWLGGIEKLPHPVLPGDQIQGLRIWIPML